MKIKKRMNIKKNVNFVLRISASSMPCTDAKDVLELFAVNVHMIPESYYK